MNNTPSEDQWRKRIVSPEAVLERIEPGMSIFLGTGVAEPRTLVKHLTASEAPNLQDLELIQLVSLGDAVALQQQRSHKYRLKTFFSGWIASEAITSGRVDLIPCRFCRIPHLIASGWLAIDVAFVQVTPPNEAGYCSLGVAVDVAQQAMEQASLVVGEINPDIPVTLGDTFVPVTSFDLLVEATEPPIYFQRWAVDEVYDRIAANIASVIENGSCLAFSIGQIYDALARHLTGKRHLGIHSSFFTDALMDLVKSGAVTNRQKELFRGKSLVSYAFGTPELLAWLDRNPLVEFQSIEKVFDPLQIGRNPRFMTILPARRVDLWGRIALHFGKGNIAGPAEAINFANGADLSVGGRTIFALPSRNRSGSPNIRVTVADLPNQFGLSESVAMLVTEYGVAHLTGRTVRERAQALIDIAHPEDRAALVEQAKAAHILYPDQIFLAQNAHLYPSEIEATHTFKNGVQIRLRAIRPSDEEEMRRLFYRFSDKAVYYRYFTPLKTMPHAKMQTYVNVDYSDTLSIVGVAGESGEGRIIAEARFVRDLQGAKADVAFVVDEAYQGMGIATYLYRMLIRLARQRGIQGFHADVLSSNRNMLKVFEKGGLPVKASLEDGVYSLWMPFGRVAENDALNRP